MYHRGEFLSLQVPGLAEGRPSLLIGDRVILSVAEKSILAPSYEGIIHEVIFSFVLPANFSNFQVQAYVQLFFKSGLQLCPDKMYANSLFTITLGKLGQFRLKYAV